MEGARDVRFLRRHKPLPCIARLLVVETTAVALGKPSRGLQKVATGGRSRALFWQSRG